jgi:hypothetical protein
VAARATDRVADTPLPDLSCESSPLGSFDPNWEQPWLSVPGELGTWVGDNELRRLEEELAELRARNRRRRGPAPETLQACRIALELQQAGRTWREIDQRLSDAPYYYSAGTAKRLVRRYRSLLAGSPANPGEDS